MITTYAIYNKKTGEILSKEFDNIDEVHRYKKRYDIFMKNSGNLTPTIIRSTYRPGLYRWDLNRRK